MAKQTAAIAYVEGNQWRTRIRESGRRNLPGLVIAAGSFLFWIWNGREQWFVFDEWHWWLTRVEWPLGEQLWTPYLGSLNAGLFGVWALLEPIAGMSYMPYQLVSVAFHAVAVLLLWNILTTLELNRWLAVALVAAFAFTAPTAANVTFGWQLAWTASIAMGFIAIRLCLSRYSHWAGLGVFAGLLFGPPGVAFAFVVLALSAVRKDIPVLVQSLLALALWVVWRQINSVSTMPLAEMIEFLVSPIFQEYLFSGILIAPSALFGMRQGFLVAALGIVFFGFLISAYSGIGWRRAAVDRPVLQLALASTFGLLMWWAMLAIVRSGDAQGDPGSFGPDAWRYQQVSLALLFLAAPLLTYALNPPAIGAVAVAILVIWAGILSGAEFAQRYQVVSEIDRNNLCAGKRGPLPPARVAALREEGLLRC